MNIKIKMMMEMIMTMKMAMISVLWFYLWRLAPPRGARDELRVAACFRVRDELISANID